MIKLVAGIVARVITAIVLVVAALFLAPVVLPVQAYAQAFVLELAGTLRAVGLMVGGSITLALVLHALRGDRAIYPDEYGQLPIAWRVLRKHPELALHTIQQHQQTRIIAAKNPMPTHMHYAPKLAPGAEPALLESFAGAGKARLVVPRGCRSWRPHYAPQRYGLGQKHPRPGAGESTGKE